MVIDKFKILSVYSPANTMISGNNSAILSGFGNEVSGDSSVILGGSNNTISGDLSLAFGKGITVDNNHETVFYNGSPAGKVGINEESPDEALHVVGTAKIDSLLWLVPKEDPPFTTGDGTKEGIMYFDTDHKLYIWTYTGSAWDWRAVAFE